MRVLCAYTDLHPGAAAALAVHAPGAELEDISRDLLAAYWQEITVRWGGSDDLAVVEHDIEIHAGVLPAFASCPEPWCVFPYEVTGRGTWLDWGLGCTRFRLAAQRAVPVAAIEAQPGSCPECSLPAVPGCWRHLDQKIFAAMTAAGIGRCVHWPAVTHLKITGPPAESARWLEPECCTG